MPDSILLSEQTWQAFLCGANAAADGRVNALAFWKREAHGGHADAEQHSEERGAMHGSVGAQGSFMVGDSSPSLQWPGTSGSQTKNRVRCPWGTRSRRVA